LALINLISLLINLIKKVENPVIKARMQKHRITLLLGVPMIFLLIVFAYYWLGGNHESTDNAYIQAAKAGINSNVAGQVLNIYVRDNQRVNQGDPLFQLDDRSYKIAVDIAKAHLTDARLQVLVIRATYLQALAKSREAKNSIDYAEREYKRQKKLSASGVSSDMQLKKVENDLEMARQQYQVAMEGLAAALAQLNNDADIDMMDHPLVQAAQANLDQAQLNYSYTTITAPLSGTVTKVDLLQPGDFIRAGEPVFALISSEDIWIEANFKETQISNMRPGQNVKIDVDAYPDNKFFGKIVSLSPGTGSTFSLLPPENATGNWVKIVQRVPVRIAFNKPLDDVFLASGLSATVTVDIKEGRPLSETKKQ